MLPPYTRNMYQDATYWGPGSPSGFGTVGWAAPVLIKCRWEDKNELFIGPEGQELRSTSVVYVDRELTERGYLALGDHTADATPTDDAREIRGRGQSPHLHATVTLNKVWL